MADRTLYVRKDPLTEEEVLRDLAILVRERDQEERSRKAAADEAAGHRKAAEALNERATTLARLVDGGRHIWATLEGGYTGEPHPDYEGGDLTFRDPPGEPSRPVVDVPALPAPPPPALPEGEPLDDAADPDGPAPTE